jgi:hypothetical protein
MAKKNKQAKKMAAKGKSALQIQQKTGVGSKTANRYVAKKAPSPSPSRSSQPSQPSQPQKQPTMTGVATKDGRYSYGAQKQAQKNYQRLGEQGVTDAFNPGKAGSRANVMADGFVNKKELNKFAKRKDTDADKARKKLSSKGAAFSAGANKRADSVFAKNNPFLAMMIGSPSEGFMNAGLEGKGKGKRLDIFKGSSSFDYKNKLPGEVFSFRPDGTIQGNQPVPNVDRLSSIFSNPDAKKLTEDDNNDDNNNNNGGDGTTGTAPVIPEEEEEELDPGQGMMSGGGMGALGASKLLRARSRLARLGILNRGTGLFGRGLQYGNSLNA